MKGKRQRPQIKYTDFDGDIKEIVTRDESIYAMMNRFAKFASLYSCFIDVNGRMIGAPTGPATNLGDFYDLFETPIYKEYYIRLKAIMLERCRPHLFTREKGMPGRFAAAPISLEDKLLGFWVLGSYTQEETERLEAIYEEQWDVAATISELVYNHELLYAEREKLRVTAEHLDEALSRERVLRLALKGMQRRHRVIDKNEINDFMGQIGKCLKVSSIYFFAIKEPGSKEFKLHNAWNKEACNKEIKDSTRLLFELEQSEAVIYHPILVNDELYGKLFFESEPDRVWEQQELMFSRTVKHIIQAIAEVVVDDSKLRYANNQLIETYNNFNVGIFIRDAQSGKVLFSNAKMNEMMGQDFTGGDSRMILTDLHDRFDGMDGIRKPFITQEKITTWRRYIRRFDAIMDITEMQLELIHGEPASLIILRKANDL